MENSQERARKLREFLEDELLRRERKERDRYLKELVGIGLLASLVIIGFGVLLILL